MLQPPQIVLSPMTLNQLPAICSLCVLSSIHFACCCCPPGLMLDLHLRCFLLIGWWWNSEIEIRKLKFGNSQAEINVVYIHRSHSWPESNPCLPALKNVPDPPSLTFYFYFFGQLTIKIFCLICTICLLLRVRATVSPSVEKCAQSPSFPPRVISSAPQGRALNGTHRGAKFITCFMEMRITIMMQVMVISCTHVGQSFNWRWPSKS